MHCSKLCKLDNIGKRLTSVPSSERGISGRHTGTHIGSLSTGGVHIRIVPMHFSIPQHKNRFICASWPRMTITKIRKRASDRCVFFSYGEHPGRSITTLFPPSSKLGRLLSRPRARLGRAYTRLQNTGEPYCSSIR